MKILYGLLLNSLCYAVEQPPLEESTPGGRVSFESSLPSPLELEKLMGQYQKKSEEAIQQMALALQGEDHKNPSNAHLSYMCAVSGSSENPVQIVRSTRK
jgi:hypothetical protein